MIKLGRITMPRFREALEPFGIRPRHVAALIELRDRGELTQQSLCGQLHLDPTNLVAILNELEERGFAPPAAPRTPASRRWCAATCTTARPIWPPCRPARCTPGSSAIGPSAVTHGL